MERYRKAIAASLGAGVTAGLGIWGPDTKVGHVLLIVSAVLTALSVFSVPNVPDEPATR